MINCRKSADPVGRLLLHMFDCDEAANLELSDKICTALQLVNHAQDVKSDYLQRGRIYLPQDRLTAHGVTEADFDATACSAGLKRCIAELADFCTESFRAGQDLPRRVGGRLGLELRAILNGACLVLERLQRVDYEVFRRRPTIEKADAPDLLIRSLRTAQITQLLTIKSLRLY